MTPPTSSLVVLDVGTSQARAALYRGGAMEAESRRGLSLNFPAPGHAEQDAQELADASEHVLREVCERLTPGETAALGISNQRSTVVAWDAESGRPLGPALSWRDSRARAEAVRLSRAVPDLGERTGLPASPHYGAAKLAWLLAHSPSVARAREDGTLRAGPVSSWVVARLTRGASFTVDPTNAQRMQLMDLRRLAWDEDLLRAAGVEAACLPAILPTDGWFGEARIGGRTIPIRAMLGDQQAALIGHEADGTTDVEVVRVHLGTGGFVLRDVGSECRAVPGLLSGLARADANRPRRHLVEGTVNSVGSAFDRLRELGLLGADETVDQLFVQSTAPVTLVPAWAGLASPRWEAGARAVVAGWDEAATRADFVAGAVRGISFLVADIVDALRGAGLAVRRLDLSGGVSRVGCLARAIAAAAGCPVQVRANSEASLEGIATALAQATGALPPFPSVERGAEIAPGEPLAAERAAFALARELASKLARTAG